MHELGVTFHIMDHLEKVAEENKVTHIRKVTLELGEVSTVIEPICRIAGRGRPKNGRCSMNLN